MDFKKKYFNFFTEGRDKNLETSIKNKLAEREVKTISFLLENFYDKHFFSNSNQLQILDLGCGDQLIKEPLEKKNTKYKGLDIEDLNLENEKFPIDNDSIDLIVSVGLIEALSSTDHFFMQSNRVLKKSGYIYLITPNWLKDYKNFYRNPFHKKPFTPDSLENTLKLSEFENIRTFPGLRCKPKWFYEGKYRFEKAYYLFPFSGLNFINHKAQIINNKLIPSFLKGHSRSIIAIAQK